MENEFLKRAEEGDGQYAVAYALLVVARAIHKLGVADAMTPMGAIEALSVEVAKVAGAIEGLRE